MRQAFRAREAVPPSMLQPVISRMPQLPGSQLIRRSLAARGPKPDPDAGDADAHGATPSRLADARGPAKRRGSTTHTPGFAHGSPTEYTAARSKLKLASKCCLRDCEARLSKGVLIPGCAQRSSTIDISAC